MFYELIFVIFTNGLPEDVFTLQRYETKEKCEEVVKEWADVNVMAYCQVRSK